MLQVLSRKKLKYSSANVNVTFTGNSLVAGTGSSGPPYYLPSQVTNGSPIAGTGITVHNTGVGAATWASLVPSSVNATFVGGKKNVLIAWETTNDIYFGATPAQATIDMLAYFNAILALNTWSAIVLLTCHPRWFSNQPTTNTLNANLTTWNNSARANYKLWGMNNLTPATPVILCDVVSPGSPFVFDTTNQANWSATLYSMVDLPNSIVHLTDVGYGVIAGMVGAALARVPG